MKFVSLSALAAILIAGQSCMSIFTQHGKATVQVETNTPVKVYVYSLGKKKFIPAYQFDNYTAGNRSSASIKFKKVTVMRPTATTAKQKNRNRMGEELVISKKKYTAEMYRSGVTEVTGFDTVLRTDIKQEMILKLVPDDPHYKEVIYQVNAQMNKKRKNRAIALNLPLLPLSIPFIMGDLNANQVQYDLPKKIIFMVPPTDKSDTVPGETKNSASTGNATKGEVLIFTEYATKTADKLEGMKKEAIEKSDYELAAQIKKEQDIRAAEIERINVLQKQLDEKVKEEDYDAAVLIKKEMQSLKDRLDKKHALRKDLEAALTAEDYTKAEKIKEELKALY